MAVSIPGTRDSSQADLYQPGNRYAVSYKTSEGVLALPLAEANPSTTAPVEIVRVHQPYRIRTVEFEYTKNRTPPLLPAPEDNDLEYVLSSEMVFPLPSVNADLSSLNWHGLGRISFIESGAWSIASGYRIGDYPCAFTPAVLGGTTQPFLNQYNPAGFGEDLADGLSEFTSEEYQTEQYDYNLHFPSRYLVSELSKGN